MVQITRRSGAGVAFWFRPLTATLREIGGHHPNHRLERYKIPYQKGFVMTVTASEARNRLFPLIEEVNANHTAVEITSRGGDAVLMSRDEYDALVETAFVFRFPANAQRLLDTNTALRAGRGSTPSSTRWNGTRSRG